MRFHVLGIPHTVTNKNYTACAYTQKILKLCAMLRSLGHTVIHYGCEGSEADCNEHVQVTTLDDLIQSYPDFDHHKAVFRFNPAEDHVYKEFYANAISEIHRRKQKNDFLLCMWGHGHRPVADAHPDMIVVEPGIGYAGGHFARWKVFESYALLHSYLGLNAVSTAGHCENYSVVIPNYFDLSEFSYSDRKSNYFLCLGRVNAGKGVHIAVQACETLNEPLVIAGQGQLTDIGYGGPDQTPTPPNVCFVGHADVEQRRKLLRDAKGLFLLSQYVEPFGGVTIEAMLSGTPVITSDWGVFPETVPHGLVGYRCRTFADILWAVQNIGTIRSENCRGWAEGNYSMERVALMYDKFFRDVLNVYTGKGWYELPKVQSDLSWLEKYYPRSSDVRPGPPGANVADRRHAHAEPV